MQTLPRISALTGSSSGWGFYLCARKEVRTGKSGAYLAVVLQDISGEIKAKVFQDVDTMREEFEAGSSSRFRRAGTCSTNDWNWCSTGSAVLIPCGTPLTASGKKTVFRVLRDPSMRCGRSCRRT